MTPRVRHWPKLIVSKSIRDKAIAMQEYARQAKDTQLIEWATEIRLRAERKAGQILGEMADSGERPVNRPAKGSHHVTLSKLGVSPMQSSRWQKLGAMSDEAFEMRASVAKRQAVASVDATSQERAEEKQNRRMEREAELGARQCALPDKKYGVIYADPPWRFEPWSRETGIDRAADNHYPTSRDDVLASLDVASISAGLVSS